ncbi:LCP family glycopolymer transferase [Ornithinibacillus halotolerans]|uniref:Transcriptional regulator LytR n=1 Tax=Ornithinibacillus halotolerans TaxID=1274357 RepID=A0A916RS52_9BACI|nr:LCP family protein [Ornithinibacillus halotolerans]GGA65047.1 transcriptional regulator LytR [Ornithinibacillus halotolerans]
MTTEKRSRRQDKPKKNRKGLKITLIVIGIIIIGVGAYGLSIYNNLKETVNVKMHKPVEAIDVDISKGKIGSNEPLNILLMGIDKREYDSGRSDTLIVLSVNPKNDTMQMISIPRDTYVEIVGRGHHDKVNHAYAFGGADMAINTVENFLDIELDYYVSMNMEGLADMVDAIGGITVQNKLDWEASGFHYAPGDLQLDGEHTMGYVRMRKQDPRGDFGRTERQRQVIQAIIKKGASLASVNKIGDMVDVLGNNMETNMDFDVMKDLVLNYKNVTKNSVSYMMEGQGTSIGGIYYYVVPEEEIAKVHDMIEKGGQSPL